MANGLLEFRGHTPPCVFGGAEPASHWPAVWARWPASGSRTGRLGGLMEGVSPTARLVSTLAIWSLISYFGPWENFTVVCPSCYMCSLEEVWGWLISVPLNERPEPFGEGPCPSPVRSRTVAALERASGLSLPLTRPLWCDSPRRCHCLQLKEVCFFFF